jgi:DTW domain-containing protein YfiP
LKDVTHTFATPADARRRPLCARCASPLARCLCALVADVDNLAEVLLLQHPLEQAQAKGTARLLALSLRHSHLMVGERFEPGELLAALHAPTADGTAAQPVLLYPAAARDPLFLPGSDAARQLRLVVIDATWRKSRKMLALNPALQALPRLALEDAPPSRYSIRRAESPEQRSTLEATLLALEQVEGRVGPYTPLWAAMDALMALLASRRPPPQLPDPEA